MSIVERPSGIGAVLYSVVIPAFNEADSLPTLVAQLGSLMNQLDDESEVIIVDDGSQDATSEIALAAQADPRFRLIRLSRNFGHQVALTAGLSAARGSAVITMDADLQHPVSIVPEMIHRWREGYDVVYGVMVARPSESAFKRRTANLFYRALNRFADVPMPSNAGDFRLLDRSVVDAFLSMPERNRYLRGMFSWLGFRQIGVAYECAPRHAGRSTYSFLRMLKLASDALFSFSVWPLRVTLAAGLTVSAVALLLGAVTLITHFTSYTVPGWTTIVVVVSFLGGIQLTLIGILGEYIGRIYEEVKARPLYVTTEQAPKNLGSPDAPSVVRSENSESDEVIRGRSEECPQHGP